jgi:hypothetical protein
MEVGSGLKDIEFRRSVRPVGSVARMGNQAPLGTRLLIAHQRRSLLCCRTGDHPRTNGPRQFGGLVTFNPDPHRQISIRRPACQPLTFCRAPAHPRVGPQELNHCGPCVAVHAKVLAEAALVERLPGSANKLPPNPVGRGNPSHHRKG